MTCATVEYTAEAGLNRDRRSMDVQVLEELGDTKKLDPQYDNSDLILVLDPDGDLWARERGRPSTDDLFGSNALVQ